MILNRHKAELERAKKNNARFSYELKPIMNMANLYFDGVKIGEFWGRDECGHIYTNCVTPEEARNALNAGRSFKYISTGTGGRMRYNYHSSFILKYSIMLRTYDEIYERITHIIAVYLDETEIKHATKSFDEAPFMYEVQYDNRMLRGERIKKL